MGKIKAALPLTWKKSFNMGFISPSASRYFSDCDKDTLCDKCNEILNQTKDFSANLKEWKQQAADEKGCSSHGMKHFEWNRRDMRFQITYIWIDMNNIMNENWLWYCDICNKTINFKSRVRHLKSKSHKEKDKYNDIVKEYDFLTLGIDQLDYILNGSPKKCRENFFQKFNYKCVHDTKFKNMENNDKVLYQVFIDIWSLDLKTTE